MSVESETEYELEQLDDLSGLTADLVSTKKYEPFLERLFARPATEWVDVLDLCEGLGEIEQQLTDLADFFEDEPRVAWFEYPFSMYEEGFCLIFFFLEAEVWTQTAVYNKAFFFQNRNLVA